MSSLLQRKSVSASQPTVEPLTLAEAKAHLLISTNDTTHDDYVTACIEASRQEFEHDTQSLTVQRTVQEQMVSFPSVLWSFYYRPVVLLNYISYFDEDNNSQMLSDIYSVDYPNRRIYLNSGETWPAIYQRWDAVSVNYDAGFLVDAVPETAKAAIKLKLNELFELRGLAPNQTTENSAKAYELMVQKYARSNYP